MTTDQESRRRGESDDTNELRALASRALSTFVFPPDEGSLFSPLAEATGQLCKPYAEICLTLRSTLSGLLSAVSVPYTMANLSAHDRHWQRISGAARIRSLMLNAELGETKEALDQRREAEALMRAKTDMDSFVRSSEGRSAVIRDTLVFLDRLSSDESFVHAANELVFQGVVLCWSGFEILVRDCFVTHLNAHPGDTLTLLGDNVAKRRFEVSKISLETLAEHDFDLSTRMGTFLAKHQDFSDVYSVKSVYKALFPDNGKLYEALNNEDLRLLSLRRNLIVHQRGVIDGTYVTSSHCAQRTGERLKLTPDDLEVHLRTTIKSAVVILDSVSTRKPLVEGGPV